MWRFPVSRLFPERTVRVEGVDELASYRSPAVRKYVTPCVAGALLDANPLIEPFRTLSVVLSARRRPVAIELSLEPASAWGGSPTEAV
jgi:hypothetical protein